MTSKPANNKPVGTTFQTRLAILEQSYIALANENQFLRERNDRLFAFVFGSDNPNEDSLKSQVKAINQKVEQLFEVMEKSQNETQTIRDDGFNRIERLEAWQKTQIESQADKKGVSRQYIYLVVSVLFSNAAGILIGLLFQKLITP